MLFFTKGYDQSIEGKRFYHYVSINSLVFDAQYFNGKCFHVNNHSFLMILILSVNFWWFIECAYAFYISEEYWIIYWCHVNELVTFKFNIQMNIALQILSSIFFSSSLVWLAFFLPWNLKCLWEDWRLLKQHLCFNQCVNNQISFSSNDIYSLKKWNSLLSGVYVNFKFDGILEVNSEFIEKPNREAFNGLWKFQWIYDISLDLNFCRYQFSFDIIG